MKKLLSILMGLILCVVLACGILLASGTATIDDLLAIVSADSISALQTAWKNTTQYVLENGAQLYNQLADHTPPSGDGHLLEGDLPEDRIPQAESLYTFPEQLYPYRAMLTADEKSAYNQVYANAMELYEQLPLHTPISTDSIMRVMSAVFYDHPELFWLETAYQYSYTSQNSVVAVTLVYNETAKDISTHRNVFNGIVQQVVSEAKKLDSAVDMEKYVHDFLLDNVNYQLDSPLNQSAYSALVYGESVCAGYSRAFQHILLELGIPTYYCAGYAGEAHAWNIVWLDDGYYHVDVAWDDPLGNESGKRYYNYFNLTDEEISKDHTRTDLSVDLPACNGTAYNYTTVYGQAEEAQPQAGNEVSNQLRMPEEAGFDRRNALSTLAEYYTYCEQRLVGLGEGTHNFAMLISDDILLGTIFELTRSKEAMEVYVAAAAQQLGYSGYSASVSLQAEGMADGYWLLTQQVHFEAQQESSSSRREQQPWPEDEPRNEALPDAAAQRQEPWPQQEDEWDRYNDEEDLWDWEDDPDRPRPE